MVHVAPLPKGQQASSALLLLTGRGDLTRDFVPLGQVEGSGTEWRLALKPKVRQTDFETLTLIVDNKTLGLRGLIVSEDQGGVRRFAFSNLKENQGISDSAFVFKIPKGVEVQR
jgi:outer membrane lipoprotein-sorting protein